jgi:hypothetical protein
LRGKALAFQVLLALMLPGAATAQEQLSVDLSGPPPLSE